MNRKNQGLMEQLKFDELNNIVDEAISNVTPFNIQSEESEDTEDKEETIDWILDVLILSYVFGYYDGNMYLKLDKEPDTAKMEEAIYTKIAGEDWTERIRNGSDVATVLSTESMRVYNTALLDYGASEDVYKTWHTMRDDVVRDTHFYLDGKTVPLQEEFYTYDNDHAMIPGGFILPENNVNCRCRISLQGSK